MALASPACLTSRATSRNGSGSSAGRSASFTTASPKCGPPRASSTSSWASTEPASSPLPKSSKRRTGARHGTSSSTCWRHSPPCGSSYQVHTAWPTMASSSPSSRDDHLPADALRHDLRSQRDRAPADEAEPSAAALGTGGRPVMRCELSAEGTSARSDAGAADSRPTVRGCDSLTSRIRLERSHQGSRARGSMLQRTPRNGTTRRRPAALAPMANPESRSSTCGSPCGALNTIGAMTRR